MINIGQYDLYMFLKENEGKWFSTVELSNRFKCMQVAKLLRKLTGTNKISCMLRPNGNGNRRVLCFGYNCKEEHEYGR